MNRLHPLSAVTMVLQQAVTWVTIPFFLVVFLSGIVDVVEYSWVFVLVPLGLLLGTTYALVYYYRFEYGITPDTFDVRSGVFSRRSREIPYGRIQNIDIARGVVQRLLGLAVVSIETAGGGNTEATLRFVSESEANRLQHQIRRRTAEATERRRRRADIDSDAVESGESPLPDDSVAGTPGEESASDPDFERADGTATAESGPQISESDSRTYESHRRRLFDLEARELLLYSFTSFRPAAVAAVLFVFFLATDTILDVLVTIAQPVGGPEDLENGTTGSYGVLTIVSMVNGLVITYLLSVAYTFATYYDFQLGRIDEDFVYERGLLQRYSGSIPVEKVQSVTVTANPVQRLIEYAGLWVETAGYGPDSGSGSQSAVPLADRRRVYAFTENLTGVERPRFHTPPTIARRRYLVRYSLIAAAIVAVAFGTAWATPLERWYLAAVVFLVVPPAAHLRYVNLGYYVGEDHLVVRRGFWRRRTTVIPYYRIQTVSTRRSIFQRRLGLASLVIDTASSRTFYWATPTIYDIDLEDAREANGVGRTRLQSALRERAQSDDVGLSVDFT
ncbi:PH domain-containing protein [Natrialba sp. INN-245]|uniref:PH domain-containing protein n=1 Tax=Natrialba sp. INN-245 TaxID=2690967 RepID=UPI00131092B6|nr:PH domain-containing protein [Natrialba sp. INN-245]MWV41140.1 PH domain-containing protein [Natrialba sp. INN-245]